MLSTAESSASSPTALLFSGGDQSAPKCNRQKVTRSRQLSDMRAMANALESKLDGLKCRVYSERPESWPLLGAHRAANAGGKASSDA